MNSYNLALLPQQERDAIELDKKRWLEAHKMLKTKSPMVIRAWLNNCKDSEYREDMRRRLNYIRESQK